MAELRQFCVECRGNFGILDRAEDAPNTCTECYVKLRPSWAGECDECRRVIQIGEKYHLRWAKLCAACVKKINRSREAYYECD